MTEDIKCMDQQNSSYNNQFFRRFVEKFLGVECFQQQFLATQEYITVKGHGLEVATVFNNTTGHPFTLIKNSLVTMIEIRL